MVDLLEPWVAVGSVEQHLEAQLARELHAEHVLAGRVVRAVARRGDNDDVLFEVEGKGYAVVHLTWARQRVNDARLPRTRFFASLDEWVEHGMTPDHEDYGDSP